MLTVCGLILVSAPRSTYSLILGVKSKKQHLLSYSEAQVFPLKAIVVVGLYSFLSEPDILTLAAPWSMFERILPFTRHQLS